jgi:AAHS family 4-hydroxybenzoate transporter-like MFS transporter
VSTDHLLLGIQSAQPRSGGGAREVNIGDLIDARPLSRLQLTVLTLCFLVVLLDGFDNQVIGIVAGAMAKDLRIPLTQFGAVFGTGLAGMILSGIFVGPLADRWGRKRMLIVATLCFGVASLLTVRVQTLPELLIVRFLTGIGLGGVLPNIIALTAEFSPRRLSRTCITAMICGLPAGAVIGGLLAAALLPHFGWQAMFYVGGLAPIVLAVMLMFWLPESIRYLIMRGAYPERVARIVRALEVGAIDGGADTQGVLYTSQDSLARSGGNSGGSVRRIFTEGRALSTIFLWIPYFLNLTVLYFILNWLPAVIVASGRSQSLGIAAITAFSIGGIMGCLIQGPLMNRVGAARSMIAEFLVVALYATLLGTTSPGRVGLVIATVVAGGALVGIQAGLNALAAEIYPTAIRATGAGWALGVGRCGSIAGPIAGGLMLSMHWDAQQIFRVGIVPSLLAAAAIFANHLRRA